MSRRQKKIVFTTDAVPPLPVFSQATIAKGVVYCSGNIGCTKDFVLVEGGVQAQTRRALENLSIVLKAAGSSLDDIVKANIYLTNMNDFREMNEVYAEFFKENLPARTCVAVVALPLGASVEIECTALVADDA
ncbi:Endoribonuclease L-PSP/chorismate mutase-like protein [Mycena olivaceomarginata]|nr:Endoribonuclease L-PSP/chorismate mutase-like protein [Mycena olivaceomarginata]KAJ7905850.1 Endoribonuclease L-PSP/chorismate mutase-like protein [Mycena olivaceomarginata]